MNFCQWFLIPGADTSNACITNLKLQLYRWKQTPAACNKTWQLYRMIASNRNIETRCWSLQVTQLRLSLRVDDVQMTWKVGRSPSVVRSAAAVTFQLDEVAVVHAALAHDTLTSYWASTTTTRQREWHCLVWRHERISTNSTAVDVVVLCRHRRGEECRRRLTITPYFVCSVFRLDGGQQFAKSFLASTGIYKYNIITRLAVMAENKPCWAEELQ